MQDFKTTWNGLSTEQRGKILDTGMNLFVVFAAINLIGTPVVNWVCELPPIIHTFTDIMGIASLAIASAFGFWSVSDGDHRLR